MAAGRKPKPVALKLIDGNPGKRRIDPTPKAPPSRPVAPASLSEEARREWAYIVPRLDEIGMLSKLDRAALEVYCESVATHRAAIVLLRRGVLVEGDKGRVVKNPAAQIVRDSATTIRMLAAEFGLTPSSRARMEFPGMDPGGLDIEDLFH